MTAAARHKNSQPVHQFKYRPVILLAISISLLPLLARAEIAKAFTKSISASPCTVLFTENQQLQLDRSDSPDGDTMQRFFQEFIDAGGRGRIVHLNNPTFNLIGKDLVLEVTHLPAKASQTANWIFLRDDRYLSHLRLLLARNTTTLLLQIPRAQNLSGSLSFGTALFADANWRQTNPGCFTNRQHQTLLRVTPALSYLGFLHELQHIKDFESGVFLQTLRAIDDAVKQLNEKLKQRALPDSFLNDLTGQTVALVLEQRAYAAVYNRMQNRKTTESAFLLEGLSTHFIDNPLLGSEVVKVDSEKAKNTFLSTADLQFSLYESDLYEILEEVRRVDADFANTLVAEVIFPALLNSADGRYEPTMLEHFITRQTDRRNRLAPTTEE